ncbi:MAG: acetyl-CoA hydrolase/transferase C-terminal domain-containing protein [Marmoricola sp.]
MASALLGPALARVGESPRVVVSGNFATPYTLLHAVDPELEQYTLHMLNAQPGIPSRPGVVHETTFVGPGMRYSPELRYVPCRLSLLPLLFTGALPVDVVLLHTSTPRNGYVSMGTEVNVLPAAIESVRRRGGVVLAQMNQAMPFTYGDGVIPVEHVDAAIEVNEPLASPMPKGSVDRDAQIIGGRIAELVPNGATVQIGIGAVPDATVSALENHRGLAVWSEMISDGVLLLERSGALDTGAPVTSSFAFGEPELYEWLDGNERVRVLRTETTNDPARIATNTDMVSINTALQVDLFGQANASRVGKRIYSGFGGQTDFVVGALHAPGGQALVALRSWHPKADRSTVVPFVDEPVTSFQMSAVVTEQGVAAISGCDQRSQALNLIEQAAHPRARESLHRRARELHIL